MRQAVALSVCHLALSAAAVFGARAADHDPQARAVFASHCARCHHAGRLENPPAKGNLGNILELERLAQREDLITPGDPDASRLYQLMLSRHRPQPVFFGPLPGPSEQDIGFVRDWIAGLPQLSNACSNKQVVTQDDLARDAAAWRKAFETDAAEPLRFISLANLSNLCRTDAELAAYRDAVATLISRVAGRSVQLDTVGEASVLLAFRPADFGMTSEAWDLRAGRGDDIHGLVTAESLAARARAATTTATVQFPPETQLIDGLDPVDALALEYTRTVTLQRAAIEMRLDASDLNRKIESVLGDDAELALRLAQSGLPRREWEDLKDRLLGRSQSSTTPVDNPRPLTLALWSGSRIYKSGDLLTVYVRPSADCNLTVVAVEGDGIATVLFPNDTVTDNRVAAGALVQIPPAHAPFQLRLDKPGRHAITAICNATAKRPIGIGHDFERQRFTVLGDWRTFLLGSEAREAAYQKTQDDLRRFRTGAGRADALEEQLPLGTEDEARAGVSVVVEP